MFGSAPATFMMSRPFHHHGHSQDEYTVAAESLLQLLAWLANGVHTRIHSGRENLSQRKALRPRVTTEAIEACFGVNY